MNRDWRGLTALILSIGIAVSLILAFLGGILNDKAVPQWVTYLVFAALGGVIGVVGGYVRHGNEEPPP